MFMINTSYSPIIHSNSHFTLAITYLFSLFFDPSFQKDFKKYPLRNISIAILFVYIMIALFSTWQTLTQSLYSAILDYSVSFLMLFAGFHAISTNEDYDEIIKTIKPLLAISAIYGLICFILQDNPYNRLVGIIDVGTNYNVFDAVRGYRISGFCNTSNPHAHVLTILSFIILNRKKCFSNYILTALSLLNLLLSDSRAPLADLAILIIVYLMLIKDLSKKIKIIIQGVLIIIFLLQIPIISEFSDSIINKIADTFASKGETEVTGSSLALRLTQFESAWNYFIESPLWGHGFNYYINNIFEENTDNNGLWGMESYILWLLVEQGIFMIILSIIYYILIIKNILKYRFISYYKIPLTLTIVLIVHIILNRPADIYEYFLPFIGLGIKLLQINSKNKTNSPQLNSL